LTNISSPTTDDTLYLQVGISKQSLQTVLQSTVNTRSIETQTDNIISIPEEATTNFQIDTYCQQLFEQFPTVDFHTLDYFSFTLYLLFLNITDNDVIDRVYMRITNASVPSYY
jgi:hypothetical protein